MISIFVLILMLPYLVLPVGVMSTVSHVNGQIVVDTVLGTRELHTKSARMKVIPIIGGPGSIGPEFMVILSGRRFVALLHDSPEADLPGLVRQLRRQAVPGATLEVLGPALSLAMLVAWSAAALFLATFIAVLILGFD